MLRVAIIPLLLLGCAAPVDRRVTTSDDPWMSDGGVFSDGPLRAVPTAGRAKAVAMLEEREWVELPADSPLVAADLAGGGEKVYLVRGLVLQGREGSDGYAVRINGAGTLRVGFHCLGGSPAPTARTPLIVRLPRPPANVETTVNMAQ